MGKKPGIRELCCKVCGRTREVETGIQALYCCSTRMQEIIEENEAKGELHLKDGSVVRRK